MAPECDRLQPGTAQPQGAFTSRQEVATQTPCCEQPALQTLQGMPWILGDPGARAAQAVVEARVRAAAMAPDCDRLQLGTAQPQGAFTSRQEVATQTPCCEQPALQTLPGMPWILADPGARAAQAVVEARVRAAALADRRPPSRLFYQIVLPKENHRDNGTQTVWPGQAMGLHFMQWHPEILCREARPSYLRSTQDLNARRPGTSRKLL